MSAQVIQFPRRHAQQVTLRALAGLLGVSVRKVYYLRKQGMPSSGIGLDGRRYFVLAEVEDWLRANNYASIPLGMSGPGSPGERNQ